MIRVRWQSWAGLGAFALTAAMTTSTGCAGSPPPTVQKLYVNGVRQRPLTEAEAEQRLRKGAPQYEICYRREMLNLTQKLSSYIFRVWIPTDGSGADVEMEKATVKNQITLQECLEEAISRVPFPAHNGQPITLRVPVKGPA